MINIPLCINMVGIVRSNDDVVTVKMLHHPIVL